MHNFKVHILYDFKPTSFGGANQFLTGLKKRFRELGVYVENPLDADVLLVNAHNNLKLAHQLVCKKQNLRIVHRLNGVFAYSRKEGFLLDEAVINFSNIYADAAIFQSLWSLSKYSSLGFDNSKPSEVVYNAPDSTIFYPGRLKHNPGEPLKVIVSSWSDNLNKGFDIYQWLDDHIERLNLEVTFVGNSKVKFKSIKTLPAMDSSSLAQELRKNHVFLTATRNDACSNSLIEAIHCGLIPIALDSGGSPELVKEVGFIFKSNEQLARIFNDARSLYVRRSDNPLPDLTKVADIYLNVMASTLADGFPHRRIQNRFYASVLLRFTTEFLSKFYRKLG